MTDKPNRYDWKEWSADPSRWDSNTAAPGIWQLANAIQVWSAFQNRPTSVAEAAGAFNCDPLRVIEAIDEGGPFMCLEGPRDNWDLLLIEHDGE